MDALLPKNFISKDTAVVTLADKLGMSRGQVIQFLNLTRIPSDLRGWLREMADLAEARLRPMVQMNPAAMRVTVGRVFGLEVLSRTS